MKKQRVLPNLLTASSLCCGLFVIFKMNMISPGMTLFSQVQTCVTFLLLASVLDVLDGAVARAMGGESEFGGFFDSMADAVSFGVAPSVVVLKTLSVTPGTLIAGVLSAAAMTYSVGGVLRLVRFSTTPPADDVGAKSTFTGLPITAASMAAVSPTLLLCSDFWPDPVSESIRVMVAIGTFTLLAYLMVSRWRFPSLKAINVRVSSPQLLVATVFVSSILLVLAFNNFPAVLFLISWGYVLVAWALACIRLAQGKRKVALDESEELEEI